MTPEKLDRLNELRDRIKGLDSLYSEAGVARIYTPAYVWALSGEDEEVLDRFRAFIKAELDMAMEEFKNA